MRTEEASVVLRVNGAMESRSPGITLADLIAARAGWADRRRVAASVNGMLVPRCHWARVRLADGDGVAILMLVHSR
jgi:thiamine biosynthesis protein ThiS